MQPSHTPAQQPEAAPTPTAQMFYVYLRANAADSDEPGYRQAIYVSDDHSLMGHGELLDYPVLMKRVLAFSAEQAATRFRLWQATGLDGVWLLSQPEMPEVEA